jgi:hypothetical protein
MDFSRLPLATLRSISSKRALALLALVTALAAAAAPPASADVANGDRDALDIALRSVETLPSDPGRWNDPRDAALYDAGTARTLVAGIDRSAAAAPMIQLAPAGAPAADVELGLASQAVGELAQSPHWIVQDDAQRFIVLLTSRYEQLAPDSAAAGARLRAATRPASLDRDATLEALRAMDAALEGKLGRARSQRFVAGVALAQLAYASAITHSESIARGMLYALSATPVIDDVVPGWAAARVQGAAIRSTDWMAQHAYAVHLAELIQKANRS